MDRTLCDFIKALRGAGVRISMAESIDAVNTLHLVGYADRNNLKLSLAQVLAKSSREKELFDPCFELFYSFGQFTESSDDGADAAEIQQGELLAEVPGEAADDQVQSPLGRMLLAGDRSGLATEMAGAAQAAGITNIVLFTQTGMFTRRIMEEMGLDELTSEIFQLEREASPAAQALAEKLQEARDYLFNEAKNYVEQQLDLYSEASTRQTREKFFRKIPLSRVEQSDFHHMHQLVQKMAKRLIALHSRRRKTAKRGQLDVRKTLRGNLAHDGIMFDLRWKSKKVERPKVFAVCDVSGSVQTTARFLLMFLYSLNEVLPKVRSFAFSSGLAEVTEYFESASVEEAIPLIMDTFGPGSTDYGQAFVDFKKLCYEDIDHRSTVIILGDARSNYGDPQADILRQIYQRSKQVIWLNPEHRSMWSSGDSEMRRLAPSCHRAEVCNSLTHLERMVSHLLRTAI